MLPAARVELEEDWQQPAASQPPPATGPVALFVQGAVVPLPPRQRPGRGVELGLLTGGMQCFGFGPVFWQPRVLELRREGQRWSGALRCVDLVPAAVSPRTDSPVAGGPATGGDAGRGRLPADSAAVGTSGGVGAGQGEVAQCLAVPAAWVKQLKVCLAALSLLRKDLRIAPLPATALAAVPRQPFKSGEAEPCPAGSSDASSSAAAAAALPRTHSGSGGSGGGSLELFALPLTEEGAAVCQDLTDRAEAGDAAAAKVLGTMQQLQDQLGLPGGGAPEVVVVPHRVPLSKVSQRRTPTATNQLLLTTRSTEQQPPPTRRPHRALSPLAHVC